jgi:hypothetical protein
MHVAHRIDMNQEAHTCDYQEHDGCERINEEGEIDGKIPTENPGVGYDDPRFGIGKNGGKDA